MSTKNPDNYDEEVYHSPIESGQRVGNSEVINEMSRELDAVSALRSLAMPNLERNTSTADDSDGDDSDHEDTMQSEDRSDKDGTKGKTSNRKASFPEKLFEVLSDDKYSDVITWLSHGKSFLIKNRKRFAEVVLSKHFKKSLFPSFTRKLNRWGFIRIGKGIETGAYYNKYFLRDNPEQLVKMRCQKRNEKKKRSSSLLEEDRENHERSRYRSLSEAIDENSPLAPNMAQSEQMHRFHLLYLTRLKHRQEHRLLMAATLQKQLDLYEQNNKESLSAFASQIGNREGGDENNQSPILNRRLSMKATNMPPLASQFTPQPSHNLQFLDLADQFSSISTSATASINRGRSMLPRSMNPSNYLLASIASFTPNTNTVRMNPPRQQWELDHQKEIELQKELDTLKNNAERPLPKECEDNSLHSSKANAA